MIVKTKPCQLVAQKMKAVKMSTVEVCMTNADTEMIKGISEQLIENVRQIRYGTCAVIVTVHEANPVGVKYEITPKIIWKEEVKI